jgi:hypothetical protein
MADMTGQDGQPGSLPPSAGCAAVAIGRYRCAYLLAALMALLAIYPYLLDTVPGRVVLGLVNVSIMVAAIAAASRSRLPVPAALLLGAVAIGLLCWHLFHPGRLPYVLLGIAMCLYYGFVILDLLAYVLRRGTVTADKLFAAVSVYVLIGLFWTTLLALLYELMPATFLADGVAAKAAPFDFYDFLAVSFGTLTTAGSSGIVPATHHARSLLLLEEITGVLYVAVLIARLTGIYQPNPPQS